MSSITNVNNNSSIVTVGRTTPVAPGQQTANKSIPVVLATDQTAIPVEEQNKVQSEVALSLLGIPRAEVALGIFADVNTYDVNPSEWSSSPEFYSLGDGIKHLPNEAGALVEASRNKTAVLTSKRFFRYQPGRVSAATFGIKSTLGGSDWSHNPSIRKYGIFDNFDGYYWETRNSGIDDNFVVVRRTQSVQSNPTTPFGRLNEILRQPTDSGDAGYNSTATVPITQVDDYRICGKNESEEASASPNLLERDRQVLTEDRFTIASTVYTNVTGSYSFTGALNGTTDTGSGSGTTTVNGTAYSNFYVDQAKAIYGITGNPNDADFELKIETIINKCNRDLDYWIDFFLLDMEWGGTAHTATNISNFTTALLNNYSTFEALVYAELENQIGTGGTNADLSTAGKAKLDTLINLIESNLDNAANNEGAITWTTLISDFGSRGQVDTIYDVKKNYWGYFVSSFQDDGAPDSANPYDDAETAEYFAISDTTQSTPITDPTAILYTKGTRDFTLAEVRYKCQRDIGYVIDGFKNDIAGGGNAETKYNMSMYYEGQGLSIASQTTATGVTKEASRHAYLKRLIQYDLNTRFGFATTSAEYVKQSNLSDSVIGNFSVENVESMETGARGFAGNLIALRDGLLMIHAGVNDPALLKEKEEIVTEITASSDALNTLTANRTTFRLTKDVVTFGQHIKYIGQDNGGLINGTLYKVDSVIGPKGNEFTLKTAGPSADQVNGGAVAEAPIVASADGTAKFILVNPFIFPQEYDPAYYAGVGSGSTTTGEPDPYGNARTNVDDGGGFVRGMQFPYMYARDENLQNTAISDSPRVGYVNTTLTAIETGTGYNGTGTLRTQYDKVNFIPEYINWIKNNVKPEYWGVYEYRIPRTRFSFETLNGKSGGDAYKRVYSDVATGEGGVIARAGQQYAVDGVVQSADSIYNFDFTKVTMLKIEFSWYGAVGALFLAYIPVDNGEARWVRVHHLRASNQLKIASLGNATLPITYNVFGGGDSTSLGDGLDDITPSGADYGTKSHNIVKYGASYYIDGGDRGTVRLYSYNNDVPAPAKGKEWAIDAGAITPTDSNHPYAIDGGSINLLTANGTGAYSVDPTFFMKARYQSSSRLDQNIQVVWVAANTVYLSRTPASTTGAKLVVDRPVTAYGIETKRVILSTLEGNAVRNRVQVYPTRLSTANLGDNPVRLRLQKTPIFQTDAINSIVDGSGVPNETFRLASDHDITAQNYPLSTLTPAAPNPDNAPVESGAPYLQNGESLYGWFLARIDGVSDTTVFGRLYKEADNYYFDLQETFSGQVTLRGGSAGTPATLFQFVPDLRFDEDGTPQTGTTFTEEETDGLSSVKIVTRAVTSIPETGTNVATLYLQEGTEQLELSPYFDYNKEYLSFPLTDVNETLYLAVDSDTSQSATDDPISIGITWEEQ